MWRLKNDKDRLQWIVKFMNYSDADLDGISQGDFLNLKEEFGLFLNPFRIQVRTLYKDGTVGEFREVPHHGPSGSIIVRPKKTKEFPLPEDFEIHHFKKIRREIRKLINSIVSTQETVQKAKQSKDYKELPSPIHFQLNADWTIEDASLPGQVIGKHNLAINAPSDEAILFVLAELVREGSTGNLMRCRNCESIFVRIGKRINCSNKCRRDLAFESFMKNHPNYRKKTSAKHKSAPRVVGKKGKNNERKK